MENLYQNICQIENLLNAWQVVKTKGSAGGIDGISIEKFEKKLEENLQAISRQLISNKFIPLPYKEVKIPKDDNEYRSLGLPSIIDKIVQQTVKELIEPILDRDFLYVSYGYRKNKGPVKAIARVSHLILHEKREWLTKCDIDKYFDSINHEKLFSMLAEKIKDEKLLTLIRLWVKMGKISSKMKWMDAKEGIPQGSVISPLLSNLYLHPLDSLMTNRNYGYIRYADDFVVLSRSEGEAYSALRDIKWFLEKKLMLRLNPTVEVKNIERGFDFLGITFKNLEKLISEEKTENIKQKIKTAINYDKMLSMEKFNETLNGIKNYYAKLLPQNYLEPLDEWIIDCLKEEALTAYREKRVVLKNDLKNILQNIDFISEKFKISKNKAIRDILAYCTRKLKVKHIGNGIKRDSSTSTDPIKKRKKEYQKLESEGFELVISNPGAFIGRTRKGITIKSRGITIHEAPFRNLKHIFIISPGVTISSNLISFCCEEKIPIDFINYDGKPYARIYSFYNHNVWLELEQLKAIENNKGQYLAKKIVAGKIKNQINLAKYYHKYRKNTDKNFVAIFDEKIKIMGKLCKEVSILEDTDSETLRGLLFSIEGRAAKEYWDITKSLLGEVIAFEGRERQGATDLVNSLLNYGYGILYAKIWDAVIRSGLSPFISYLHKPQEGKPTLVFDLIEEFRPQCVDRVVFSMLNKGIELKMDDKYLAAETKRKLVKEVLERINSIEDFRGKELRLVDIIKEQAKAVAAFLLDNNKHYLPYIGKW